MAGYRETFGSNVDYAYGRGTRDLTNFLQTSVSQLGGLEGLGNVAKQANSARSRVKDLVSEISKLKDLQSAASDPEVIIKLQKKVVAVTKDLLELKRQLRQLPFDLLDKGLGKITKGLTAFNSALLTINMDFLVESFKRVYELQERWTRAIGGFNMRIGGMTAGLKGAQRAATGWSSTVRGLTNGDINEGIQMFGDFTEAIGRTVESGDQFEKFGLQMARGFNLGGNGAGQLTKVLQNIGNSGSEASSVMKSMVAAANAAHVPTNLLAKDIVESSTYMARFGKESEKTFVTGAAWARKYTITMQQLRGAVEGLDMFDEAARTASRLNTAFGTMINSMDLMLEDDPAKRLEMIRQQFLAQGTTFDRLTPKQRRDISETLSLTEDQTAALLDVKNANESYEEFQQKARRRDREEVEAKRLMEKQLRATAQTMYAFGAAFDRVTVAIANAIKPLLKVLGLAGQGDKDFKSFGQVMESITVTVEDFFKSLAKNEKWQSWMRTLAVDLRDLGSALRDWVETGAAAKFIGNISEGVKRMYVTVKDTLTFLIPKFKLLVDVALELSKHLKTIALIWTGSKIFNAFGGANGFLGNALKLFGLGESAGGGKFLGGIEKRVKLAGISTAVGSAVGGASAGIGAGLGSLVGGSFGPIGMILGPIVGGLAGKAIEWIFGSSKVKNELEKAHDDLTESIKIETTKRQMFTGVLDAVRDHQEAQDRSRKASNDLLRSMDQAAARSQQKLVTLNEEEARALRARADELSLFGKSARDNRKLLDSLGAGSKLTKQQLDSLLQGSSAYESELAKLRDTTKQQADIESNRLQISAVAQQKDALELTTKLREQELKNSREQLKALGGPTSHGFIDSKGGFRNVSLSTEDRAATAQEQLEYYQFLKRRGNQIDQKEIDRLTLEAKIDKLDLQNTADQKKLLGLQTDFLRQQTIIELKRAVMSDSAFLEFKKSSSEVNRTLDQQLVDFVNSGRSALGSDPYALGLITEGSNLRGLASGTKPQASPLPISYGSPLQVPAQLNYATQATQSRSVNSTNVHVTVQMDGKNVAGAVVNNVITGRH